MNRPKIVSEEQVFPNKTVQEPPKGVIKVTKRTVKEDNGNDRVQYIWKRPEFVTVVPIANGEVLVKREFKYGAMEELLTFAAGAIKNNETPAEAARRELCEEFGLQSNNLGELGVYRVSPDKSTEIQHLIIAKNCTPIVGANREPGEILRFPATTLQILEHPDMRIALCRLAFFEVWRALNLC